MTFTVEHFGNLGVYLDKMDWITLPFQSNLSIQSCVLHHISFRQHIIFTAFFMLVCKVHTWMHTLTYGITQTVKAKRKAGNPVDNSMCKSIALV